MAESAVALEPSVVVKSRFRSRLLRREILDGYLFMSPWLLGFILFSAGPMLASAILSFVMNCGPQPS